MHVALLAILFAVVFAQNNPDKITHLPFTHGPIGNMYSGYIEVDSTTRRNLHYWFVESQGDPEKDPLVLWLNGGPGCSSLDGLLYEHGPFKFAQSKNPELYPNPYSWNKVANVLYLESPAGVGFSWSNDQYVGNNDPKTALNNYNFLKLWFKKYPQYTKNDFWITGESYAGVYVPSLANVLLNGILNKSFVIPFKGVMVGNGVSNADGETDLNVPISFLAGHGILSVKMNEDIQKLCININSPPCQHILGEAYAFMNGINLYGIYYDCAGQRPMLQGDFPFSVPVTGQVPCIDSSHANTFLNNPDVKKAIHVNETISWSICNDRINGGYFRTPDSMVPIFQTLLKNKLRVLIYSGDTDFAVPYLDSQYWTSHAGLRVSKPWAQWHFTDGRGPQVAGMVTEYSEGLTFATIRGAGHMVPQFAPIPAYKMFSNFLKGRPLSQEL